MNLLFYLQKVFFSRKIPDEVVSRAAGHHRQLGVRMSRDARQHVVDRPVASAGIKTHIAFESAFLPAVQDGLLLAQGPVDLVIFFKSGEGLMDLRQDIR